MKTKNKLFSSPLEAAKAWAQEAVPRTVEDNREYSSFIVKKKNGYKLTKPRRGAHGNVVLNALLGSLPSLFAETHLIHTHTLCSCHIPDKFSGNPKHPVKEPGDITAVKILAYKSIFLVTPDGRIFDLKREDDIQTKEALNNIKPLKTVEIKGNIQENSNI